MVLFEGLRSCFDKLQQHFENTSRTSDETQLLRTQNYPKHPLGREAVPSRYFAKFGFSPPWFVAVCRSVVENIPQRQVYYTSILYSRLKLDQTMGQTNRGRHRRGPDWKRNKHCLVPSSCHFFFNIDTELVHGYLAPSCCHY